MERRRPAPRTTPKRRGVDIFETVERIDFVENLGEVIRSARERLGLTQEELANLVQEKVSIIRKIEAGSFRPSLELARNIEKALKVRIIRELKDEDIRITPPSGQARGVTLGDILSSMGEEEKKG